MKYSSEGTAINVSVTRAEFKAMTGMERLDVTMRADIRQLSDDTFTLEFGQFGELSVTLRAAINGPVPVGSVNKSSTGFVAVRLPINNIRNAHLIRPAKSEYVPSTIQGPVAHFSLPRANSHSTVARAVDKK